MFELMQLVAAALASVPSALLWTIQVAFRLSTRHLVEKQNKKKGWTKGRRFQMPNVSPHFAHPASENTAVVPPGRGFHSTGSNEVVPRSCVCSDCVCLSVLCIPEWDYSTGRVGGPLVCCEIKLKDWAEGEYGLSFAVIKCHHTVNKPTLSPHRFRDVQRWGLASLFWYYLSLRLVFCDKNARSGCRKLLFRKFTTARTQNQESNRQPTSSEPSAELYNIRKRFTFHDLQNKARHPINFPVSLERVMTVFPFLVLRWINSQTVATNIRYP